MRLGGEASAPPPNRENQPSFIDAINAPAEPEPKPAVEKPTPRDAALDLSKAMKLDAPPEDDTDDGDEDVAESTASQSLRLGGLMKRKPEASEQEAVEAEEKAPPRSIFSRRADTDEAEARKPGNLLRVVADRSTEVDDQEPEEEEAEKPASSANLRSFLRKPAEEPEAAESAAEEDIASPLAPAAARGLEETSSVKDRLHASFAEAPEPVAAADPIELDEPSNDDGVDPLSPLGFALRADAKSLPELMTAAVAYLNIVESRATVGRNDMVDVVQKMSSDVPLTAEAKVKAVGKLVRSGTLVRLDGGMFMLDEVALQHHRDAMDGAA